MNTRRIKILRRKSWLGKLLRIPFDLIPKNSVLPILSGPLRGLKWVKGSHNISVLLGTYERTQSYLFSKEATKASVFWDLGSHVGYYSLLFRKSNPTGEIFAFEPLDRNVEFFKTHMELNGIKTYHLFNSAVSDSLGKLTFNTASTSVAGRLSENGNIVVDVVKLSDLVSSSQLKIPQLIKMDIEGEEFKVLTDLSSLLITHKPVIFLSTHGADLHRKSLTLLKDMGYKLSALDSDLLENCKEVLAK